MEADDYPSAPTASSIDVEEADVITVQSPAPSRRSRVSLACQRCKHRKQKCNGNQPSCGRCLKLKVDCHYVMPTNPKPGQARLYIKALEDRVAELENLLAKDGHGIVSRDHWQNPADMSQHEIEADNLEPLLNAVRDLSLDVAGSYVGGASTITLGRALETALAGKSELYIAPTYKVPEHTRQISSSSGSDDAAIALMTVQVGQISDEAADFMISAYLRHTSTNFPIIYSYDVRSLHERRSQLRDAYELSILCLIYGLGCHFLEKVGDLNVVPDPEMYYTVALSYRDTILRLGDTRALTYLLLLGQHCYRMPKDPGAWTFFGLAMKMCVELGLHRGCQQRAVSFGSELNKRLFWSCYWHECEIAVAMGRPPSISDHDIDVELPLEVEECTQDLNDLRRASVQDKSRPANPATTMSTIVHLLRLKRLESEIQHKLYRVDKLKPIEAIYRTTDIFLEKLQAWRAAIPPSTSQTESSTCGNDYRTYDSYMASYYKTVRVLVQPRLYEKKLNTKYVKICAEACRGLCETYKRLHYRVPIAFTSLSLQSVFLAGLSLIYCMWRDSSPSISLKDISALSDCSIVLYVMAERWAESRKYRDLFEAVKNAALEAMDAGNHVTRAAVLPLNDEMQASLNDLSVEPNLGNVTVDLEQMICDMTGEDVTFWHEISADTAREGTLPDWGGINALNWDPNNYSVE